MTSSVSPFWSPQGWFLRAARGVLRRGNPARLAAPREPSVPVAARAERLIRQKALEAAIVGGVAGLGATVSEIASIPTFGATLALWAGVSGAELSYLTYAQLRLVQDLAYLYDIPIDPDNPQDVLAIFGFAQGLRPTELVTVTFTQAAGSATTNALQEYSARQIARLVQRLARGVGWELLEHTVIKYAVPIVSIFAGAIINYTSVRSLGHIARAYLRQLRVRDGVFQAMTATSNAAQRALFPALALHTAQVSGMHRDQERLYQMLHATLGDRLPAEATWLLDAPQPALDEALRQAPDAATRRALMDACVLMTLTDVRLTPAEKQYVAHISQVLDVPVDIQDVERAFTDLHPRGLTAYLAAVSRWGCLFLAILGSLLSICWLALFLVYVQAGAVLIYGLFRLLTLPN